MLYYEDTHKFVGKSQVKNIMPLYNIDHDCHGRSKYTNYYLRIGVKKNRRNMLSRQSTLISINAQYQNNLHNSFDHEGDPITSSTQKLNSISWADDLVIFLTTQSGLQKSLDKLQQYCSKWGLSINTDKTKYVCYYHWGMQKCPLFNLMV